MVTVGYEQALRRLSPVDSPCSWEDERPVPTHVAPEQGGGER